ncbi:MAG: hypothetical protein ABID83_01200 [Candidatus Omnitrophota bacterium]
MPDTFAITIILIVVCTVAGAFIKGRTKDRCMQDFSGYPVTLEKNDEKTVWGRLCVENSGLELVYAQPYTDKKENHVETSYILYKSEYRQIKTLVRYIEDLDPELIKRREKDLERTYDPRWSARFARKTRNFFGTIRDSLLEVANLFIGRVKTATPAGKILQGQDKYTSALGLQLVTQAGTSYEPILERYIGKKCILAVTDGENKTEYEGILKDYTTEFIEIMDVQYTGGEGRPARKADLVIPRTVGTVRHSGGESIT